MSDNRNDLDMVSRRTKEAVKLRESRKLKREKQKKNRYIKKIGLIAFVVVVMYIAGACVVALKSNLTTTDALKGTVQESINVDGYVYRTQSVINAPWDGHFESLVSEGERVKAGQVIGYIYRLAPSPEIMGEIKRLQRLIRLSGANEDAEYIAGGTEAVESEISELSRDLSDERQRCNLRKVAETKEEINVLIKRRNSVNNGVVSVKDTDSDENAVISEIEQMKSELAVLESQAGESVKIVAESGGVFSSVIDGLEGELSYENADKVVPSTISELDKVGLTSVSDVVVGQPLCKIVNNYTWKYATVISDKQADGLSVGQNIQMRFYDLTGGLVKGTISRISEIESGKRAIVISANRYVDGIYATSRTSAELVTVDCSGIKLPSSCIRVKDGVTGVYVIRLDRAYFVPINLNYRNDEWAVVSAAEPEAGGKRLQIYDEVIIECKNLEEGKIVR